MYRKFLIRNRTILLLMICTLITGVVIGYSGRSYLRKFKTYIPFDDTRPSQWDNDFIVSLIPSRLDNSIQHAYTYQTSSDQPKPLVISLHSWSADYQQKDQAAEFFRDKNWNYMHPDFRGPNNNEHAGVSELVLQDIDDCIDYALEHFNADKSKIYIIGGSGGGLATLAAFMHSKHDIKSFTAWCPISDIKAWYHETRIRGLKYADDILKITGSSHNNLNQKEAELRSPIYWETPVDIRKNANLDIYAGVYDGITGSVPITHSINFYNKILKDLGCPDEAAFISEKETLLLLEKRQPLDEFADTKDRKTILKKSYKNISITIFEGEHEMLEHGLFIDEDD